MIKSNNDGATLNEYGTLSHCKRKKTNKYFDPLILPLKKTLYFID